VLQTAGHQDDLQPDRTPDRESGAPVAGRDPRVQQDLGDRQGRAARGERPPGQRWRSIAGTAEELEHVAADGGDRGDHNGVEGDHRAERDEHDPAPLTGFGHAWQRHHANRLREEVGDLRDDDAEGVVAGFGGRQLVAGEDDVQVGQQDQPERGVGGVHRDRYRPPRRPAERRAPAYHPARRGDRGGPDRDSGEDGGRGAGDEQTDETTAGLTCPFQRHQGGQRPEPAPALQDAVPAGQHGERRQRQCQPHRGPRIGQMQEGGDHRGAEQGRRGHHHGRRGGQAEEPVDVGGPVEVGRPVEVGGPMPIGGDVERHGGLHAHCRHHRDHEQGHHRAERTVLGRRQDPGTGDEAQVARAVTDQQAHGYGEGIDTNPAHRRCVRRDAAVYGTGTDHCGLQVAHA